jgi:hypothetical protein
MSNSSKNIIARVKLSSDDLKRIIVNEILKNESARKALEGKNIIVDTDWHVFKWDNPKHLVTITLAESDQ